MVDKDLCCVDNVVWLIEILTLVECVVLLLRKFSVFDRVMWFFEIFAIFDRMVLVVRDSCCL